MNKNSNDTYPLPRPGILDIAPYVGGKSKISGLDTVIKLSSNENPLGASPAAIDAVHAAAHTLELYPDGTAQALRDAIAEVYTLDADRIICGTGSDNLLELLIRAYVGPQDEVVYSQHGFLMYKIYTLSVGGIPVAAPETNLTANVDALLAAVTPRTKIVFVANPNNPTGTYLPYTELQRLRTELPTSVILVIDCAYAEYMEEHDYDSGFALTDHPDQNVVVTRTFSKIYGLASLRVGWGYCPPQIADVLNRLRSPFNVTAPALAAGVAAVRDTQHTQNARSHNTKWLSYMQTALDRLGLPTTPSYGNFVLIHFTDAEEADAADQYLQKKGYILRSVASYGLPQCLRMTIGKAEHCKGVITCLESFLKENRT